MDNRTAQIVQEEVRHSSRSLLQYLADAEPWTGSADREVLARLRQLMEEDRTAVSALVRLLRQRRVPPPYLGPYPEPFTTLNDLSLDRLLPLLVEHQQRAVTRLQGEVIPQVHDAEVRQQLELLLEVKRRHLETLTDLSKAHGPVGVRV
jgi:hypothetical protein